MASASTATGSNTPRPRSHSVLAGRDRTWRVDAITWSENNTEAIAGLHNKGRRAFVLLDEASAIPDPVWDTIEGALTDAGTELLWCVFGNPTRNTGRFRECFAGGRFAHRWQPRQIDSRSVADDQQGPDRDLGEGLGEDSDFVRVRVRGEFPRAGSLQFIDSRRVEAGRAPRPGRRSARRRWSWASTSPARASDQTVIRFRRGLDARSIPAVKLRIPDLMLIAGRVMELVAEHRPDAVFVDCTGIGWGVQDRLNQLGCANLFGIDFGGRADRNDGHTGALCQQARRDVGLHEGLVRRGLPARRSRPHRRPHRRRVRLRRRQRAAAGAQAGHAPPRPRLARRRRRARTHLRLSRSASATRPTSAARRRCS